MGLTSAELLKVITARNAGTVEYVFHSARNRMTPKERQLVEEVRANLRAGTEARQGAAASPPPWGELLPSFPIKQPLSAADLMWLDRVPRDPAEVTEEQAKELAHLAARVQPRSGDARLVQSIFEPVRARYQSQATKAAVAREQAGAPPRPLSDAVGVVAEAIARSEAPAGLDEDGAHAFGMARARQLVEAGLAQRDADHQRRITAIEERGSA